MTAGAAAGPILSHDGKVIKLLPLAATSAPARAKLQQLIRAGQELLLRHYAHPRVKHTSNLWSFKYLRPCLLGDLAELVKEMAEAKAGGQAWEDMTAEEAVAALKQVLKGLVQVWVQQAEYMVVWRSTHTVHVPTGAPCVAWFLALAQRLVPQGAAAGRVTRLLEASKTSDLMLNISRGEGAWAVGAMGQLVKRATPAASMQQGEVHTCGVIAESGKKEDVCMAAATLLSVLAAHLDGLYQEGPTVAEAVAAAAQLGRVDAGALLLQHTEYTKRMGRRCKPAEDRLLQVVRRCPPDSLPQFDGQEGREVAQESSNVVGPALQGMGVGAR